MQTDNYTAPPLSLAELLSSLSYIQDIADGQPTGHSLRSCWIGTRIGLSMGLSGVEFEELYLTLLLKDLGCTSNATQIAELDMAKDPNFKRDHKTTRTGVSSALQFMMKKAGHETDVAETLKTASDLMRRGASIKKEMIEQRCSLGSGIARKMRFSENVCEAIYSLDEHWDGSGHPKGLSEHEIPLYSRIALCAELVDLFFSSKGVDAAIQETVARSETWFDPEIVDAFCSFADDPDFWTDLASLKLEQALFEVPPVQGVFITDEEWIDDVVIGIGQMVDAKSHYTAGHSERVAEYAALIGAKLGFSGNRLKWLKRAAYLHDIGKLGVSSNILNGTRKLNEVEWNEMRNHAAQSYKILSRISAFSDLAHAAASHHEKLDGTGYPQGLKGEQISLEARIISISDFFDAVTADRPYRPAAPLEKALSIIAKEIGRSVDADCYIALVSALGDKGNNLPGACLIQPKLAV